LQRGLHADHQQYASNGDHGLPLRPRFHTASSAVSKADFMVFRA
jgi:hypothetical protein